MQVFGFNYNPIYFLTHKPLQLTPVNIAPRNALVSDRRHAISGINADLEISIVKNQLYSTYFWGIRKFCQLSMN